MTPSEQIKRLRELAYELDVLVRHLPLEAPTRPASSNAKKLTKREVARIRELKRNGFTQKAIADIFDVHPVTISRIVRGVYWR